MSLKEILPRTLFFAAVNLFAVGCVHSDHSEVQGMAVNSVAARLAKRRFPSVFQAWSQADFLNDGKTRVPLGTIESQEVSMARHDLLWRGVKAFGLEPTSEFEGDAESFTQKSIGIARSRRAQLLALNPNLIMLAEIRYHSARPDFLAENSPWWKRDGAGQRVPKLSARWTATFS